MDDENKKKLTEKKTEESKEEERKGEDSRVGLESNTGKEPKEQRRKAGEGMSGLAFQTSRRTTRTPPVRRKGPDPDFKGISNSGTEESGEEGEAVAMDEEEGDEKGKKGEVETAKTVDESGERKRAKEDTPTPEKRETKKNKVDELEEFEKKREEIVARFEGLMEVTLAKARKSKLGMVSELSELKGMFKEMKAITDEVVRRAEYREIVRKVVENAEEIKGIAKSIKSMKEGMEEGSAKGGMNAGMLYADVARRRLPGTEEEIGRSKEFVALVYPEKEALPKDSASTRDIVRGLINPAKEKIMVSGMHAVRNGGVAIRTKDRESMSKVLEKKELKEAGLLVREPVVRLPLLIVRGIPSELTEEEFYGQLREQNFRDEEITIEELRSRCEFKFKKGRRERETCSWVFSVAVEMRRKLLTAGRIFLNWSCCKVSDFVDVTRCAKCLGYGHIAKFCREEKVACGHCGEEGHVRANCGKKEMAPECINCKRAKRVAEHDVNSRECPGYRNAVERSMRSVKYE